jgi:hypothetical protein
MLDHLEHFNVTSLDEVLPLISTDFRIFHFPTHKGSKPAMYGRMWKIRKLGIDAMVREYENEFVLITRKEVTCE